MENYKRIENERIYHKIEHLSPKKNTDNRLTGNTSINGIMRSLARTVQPFPHIVPFRLG